MQHDFEREEAQRLDRFLQHDLAAGDGEARCRHRVREIARRDRAVELAALARLTDQHDLEAVELLRDLLGFALARQVLRFELRALLLEIGKVLFRRAQRLFLRQEEVARIARAHLHDLTHLAEILDPLEEDHIQHVSLALAQSVGQEPEIARALDRLRQLALLLRRDRGDAARHDLAALGDEALHQFHVLVVDLRRVRAREGAGFAPAEERPARGRTATATLAFVVIGHRSSPFPALYPYPYPYLLRAGRGRHSRGAGRGLGPDHGRARHGCGSASSPTALSRAPRRGW